MLNSHFILLKPFSHKTINIFLVYFLLIFVSDTYAQPEVLKDINGKITSSNVPLAEVNIIIIGQNRGVKTNVKGLYHIKAKVGDQIQYSHVSFKTITIIVEDITKVLNIKMKSQGNMLNEVQLKFSKGQSGIVGKTKVKPKKLKSGFGIIDTEKVGYSIGYANGNDLNLAASNIGTALKGKTSNYKVDDSGKVILRGTNSLNLNNYALWEVDGIVYGYSPPPIDVVGVKEVYVLQSLAGTVKYGSAGAGGVIIVRTKHASFNSVKEKKKTATQYTNKETYGYDATMINKNTFTNTYTNTLLAFKDKQKAFEYYAKTIKEQLIDFDTHLSIARDFNTHFIDKIHTVQILKESTEKHAKNPELLKAVAYQLQNINAKKEAIEVYQDIFKLRPSYAQSYRDLANAYRENDQNQKAWRMYMTYLLKGNDVSGEGIGQLIYNEMEWLYFNRKNQAQIKERFVPKSKNIKDFRNDVRLVFEWNTSEAEFDLEFVNPEKRVYSFEHSLEKNQDLITHEKEKGYSSKEFVIANLDDGEWLVNITYQGNKKLEPTYLKTTQYYNWGKPNQHKKIMIYQLKNEYEKIQLFTLNKEMLFTENQ